MLTLEVLQGRNRGAVLDLEALAERGGPITVGRGPLGELALGSAAASELGQIFREGERWHYLDFGATARAQVLRRGEAIALEGGRRELPLETGDELHLGEPEGAQSVACRISIEGGEEVEDGTVTPDRIQHKRAFQEFPKVAEEVTRDTATTRKLLEVTQKLARRGLELQAVFDGVAEAAFELVPSATHVAIALADEAGGRFDTVYARAKDVRLPAGGEAVRASRAVVRRVQQERDAIYVADARREMEGSASIMGARIESTIGVPLWSGETVRGVIQIDNRGSAGLFRQRDLDVLVTLAGQATLAVENARLYQRLKLAEEQLRGENRYLKNREERRRAVEIIGDSPAMADIFRQIDKVKDTRATVCIEGETGTGKELIASAIHYQGSRRDKLFVAQNCAAVPENLLESELFGHKKGSFTGADHDKKGLFEIADGGTLFLDEIAEMSLGLQAKLLRALQQGTIRPVGATSEKPVDVRIICATNRALEQEVERGAFRQDLYYRLKVFPIRLPALRERREDVPALIEHFLRRYTVEMKKPISGVTPEAMDQLAAYNWPGNIRELENEVQRLVIQADADSFITPELLSPQIRKVEELLGRIAPKKGTLKDRVEEVERWLLVEALREHGGNKTKTAETLGITREGLHKKLSKYGM